MNINVFKEFLDQGVTESGIRAILANASNEHVLNDISLFLSLRNKLYFPVTDIIGSFSTNLWVLLGELVIPNNLSWQPEIWPLVVFQKLGVEHINEIINFTEEYYGEVVDERDISISLELFCALYAGKPWFLEIYNLYVNELYGCGKGKLLWIRVPKENSNKISLASLVRKLQIILRPKLPVISKHIEGDLYPGVLRAFHAPTLNDISVHIEIIKRFL